MTTPNHRTESSKMTLVDDNDVPSPFKYKEPMQSKIRKKEDLETNDENDVPSPFKYKEPMESKIKKKEDVETNDDFNDDQSLDKQAHGPCPAYISGSKF